MKTLVRLYDDISIARHVVEGLVDAGFDRQKITLMAYDPYGDYAGYVDEIGQPLADAGSETAIGASIGGLIGGIGGLLLGLGALTLPGIGPIVAAGPIAAALLGAGTGATVGGLVGLLVEADIGEEQATLYAEGVRRGGTLVVLEVNAQDAWRAEEILDRGNPVSLEERAAGWRERGWRGYQPDDEAYTPDEVEMERNFYTFEPIYRHHYERTYASTGRPYSHYEPAYYYGYDLVARRGYFDRAWDEVEREARQEWASRGQGAWEEFESAVQHAWEEAHQAIDMDEDFEGYDYYDEGFRRHYESTYSTTGSPYATYDTAYHYGYDLANSPYYGDRDWDEIEPEVRRNWEEQTDSPWDSVRDAVSHAWNEVRSFLQAEETGRQNNGDECCDCEDLGDQFRRHYQSSLAGSGYPYNRYEYAYHYGCELANDERFCQRHWDEVEREARRDWEGRGEGAWDDFRDAVLHGWREVKAVLGDGEDYARRN